MMSTWVLLAGRGTHQPRVGAQCSPNAHEAPSVRAKGGRGRGTPKGDGSGEFVGLVHCGKHRYEIRVQQCGYLIPIL